MANKYVICRFCTHTKIDGYTGQAICESGHRKKPKHLTYEEAAMRRQCKHYELINCDKEYADVFSEIDYEEEKPKKETPVAKNQISLF